MNPPFLVGVGQLVVPKFENGGSEKKQVLGGTWVPVADIFLGACCVSCVEKPLKVWLWRLNFKCWSWPVYRNNQLMFSFVIFLWGFVKSQEWYAWGTFWIFSVPHGDFSKFFSAWGNNKNCWVVVCLVGIDK